MLLVLAQEAAPEGPGLIANLVPILLMVGVVYFVVFLPQKKQQQKLKAKIDGLKKGDQVRTRGGIVAPVVRVKDDEVVVGLGGDRSVELRIHRSYIDEVEPAEGKAAADGK